MNTTRKPALALSGRPRTSRAQKKSSAPTLEQAQYLDLLVEARFKQLLIGPELLDLAQRAVGWRDSLAGTTNLELARALLSLGQLQRLMGDYPSARASPGGA